MNKKAYIMPSMHIEAVQTFHIMVGSVQVKTADATETIDDGTTEMGSRRLSEWDDEEEDF